MSTETTLLNDTVPFEPVVVDNVPREVLAQLEVLDDTIFEAIDGDAEALDQSATKWQQALETLGPRHSRRIAPPILAPRRRPMGNASKNEPCHPPHKTFAALEIIELLGTSAAK